jgi:signal-transduction protein with cAMP-binding, CBS, and nucleotidyltransferase domain
METGVKVIDAMTKVPVSVTSQTSVIECAQVMEEHDIGSLLIIDNQKLQGIITDEDIVRRVVAKGESTHKLLAKDIMTTNIVHVSPEMDIFDAITLMNKFKIRHTPVMFRGDMIGFITLNDILKIQPDLFEHLVHTIHIREEDQKRLPPYSQKADIEPYYE